MIPEMNENELKALIARVAGEVKKTTEPDSGLRNVSMITLALAKRLAAEVEAEVPVLVLDACAQTSEVRSSGALVAVAVLLRDISIIVTVNEHALKRQTVGTVNLLVNIE